MLREDVLKKQKAAGVVFVGENNAYIEETVVIGENACTAADATITEDTLAIARARQVIKDNWKRK